MPNESLEFVSTPDNTLTPPANYYGDKVRLRLTESVLQQKAVTRSHKKVGNCYVVYQLTTFQSIHNYRTLTNALFGAVKLTINTNIEKYSGCGIGFQGKGIYSHPSGGTGKNVILEQIRAHLFILIVTKKTF